MKATILILGLFGVSINAHAIGNDYFQCEQTIKTPTMEKWIKITIENNHLTVLQFPRAKFEAGLVPTEFISANEPALLECSQLIDEETAQYINIKIYSDRVHVFNASKIARYRPIQFDINRK